MKQFVFETLKDFKIYSLNENMQRAKAVLAKHHIDINNLDFQKLVTLVGNNLGYIGKFTEFFFDDNETYEAIEEIYKMIKNVGLDIPIESFKTTKKENGQLKRGLDSLFDYLQAKRNKSKLNQVLTSLPSIARKVSVDERLTNLISNNIEFAEQIMNFYSRKGGRYKDADKLYTDTLKLITNLKGEFNLEGIKKFLKDKKANVETILERDDLLIVKVNDYETSARIGSADWCISYSSSSWESYVGLFNNQYFVYNFSEPPESNKSMIGLTVGASGQILNAHLKNDEEITNIPALEEELGI
jgi:hypothetical protein